MSKYSKGKTSKSRSKKGQKGGIILKIAQISLIILLAGFVLSIAFFIVDNISTEINDTAPTPRELAAKAKATAPKTKKEKPAKSDAKAKQKSPAKTSKPVPARSKSQVTSLSSLRPEQDLLPSFHYTYTSQVIPHTGFVLSYNADYKVPNWVLYELNYAETLGNQVRTNNFAPDPDVHAGQCAQLSDYRNSGYDRGHMAPNADLNWSTAAQDECFYLSNMCPQGHDFNAGIWLDLENQVRRWAERDSAVTIVCGPVLPRSEQAASRMKKIGKGHVLVPEYFYKIVFSPFSDRPRAIGFVMPNHNEKRGRKNRPLSEYAVSVDSIETLTGIDFFPALPDRIENEIESSYNLNAWFK